LHINIQTQGRRVLKGKVETVYGFTCGIGFRMPDGFQGLLDNMLVNIFNSVFADLG